MQVNVFVFHRSPQTLDKNVVNRLAFAVHTDLYFSFQQQSGKLIAGKLTARVGIKYFKTSVHVKGFFGYLPAPIRDFLLRFASLELYKPKWTNEIQDEWIRNVVKNRPDLKKEKFSTYSGRNEFRFP